MRPGDESLAEEGAGDPEEAGHGVQLVVAHHLHVQVGLLPSGPVGEWEGGGGKEGLKMRAD